MSNYLHTWRFIHNLEAETLHLMPKYTHTVANLATAKKPTAKQSPPNRAWV